MPFNGSVLGIPPLLGATTAIEELVLTLVTDIAFAEKPLTTLSTLTLNSIEAARDA